MASEIYKKINILEVNASLKYGGGQRNMVTFAKYFRKDIFNVSVLAYNCGGPLEIILKELSIPYFVANNDVQMATDLIQRENIDVVHIHRSGGAVPIETEIIRRMKEISPHLVVIEKNVFGKHDDSLDGLFNCSFFQSMMHINERFLPQSGKVFNFDKMKVACNMVDDDEFIKYTASTQEIIQFKRDLGIQPDDFVVGKVARPVLEKWSDLIIDAVPFLVKILPKFKIIIIGCPLSRIDRIKKSCYRNYFCLLPETADQKKIHLFYQAIDILAHCSKIGECNGNTINEAMFWKKPVVVNSTPRKDNGQLEQVDHMVSGIIANTPPTFARAINHLASNKEALKIMGENAKKQVLAINSPQRLTAQLEKCIIEKLSTESNMLSLSLVEQYDKIIYSPTADTIVNYHKEYYRRLKWSFGKMTFVENIVQKMLWPRRFYFKLKDFIEHKWQSYGRK